MKQQLDQNNEHTERWLFEDNVDPDSYQRIKETLRSLTEDLKTQCLTGARQTLADYPKDEWATSMRLRLVAKRDVGLLCALSLNRHGTTRAHFAFGSRAYAQQARANVKNRAGEDKVVSTGFERYVDPPRE